MAVDLRPLLAPRSIAVSGASANPDRMGSRALRMIGAYGFRGRLYAVNPRGEDSAGHPGFARVTDLPEVVDLCVVAAPAGAVSDVVVDCARAGVPVVQVLTSGPEGTFELDTEIRAAIAGSSTRVIGPNCLGSHSPHGRTTFVVDADPTAGSIAIVSQSGGLSLDLVNQAAARRLPLRAVVSAGNCADVSLRELVDHFVADEATSCIGLYVEGVPDAVEFVASLRAATAVKPVVLLKGGRSEQGSRSAASHTGAVAVSHDLWDAVMRQVGVIEAASPDDLLARLGALRSEVAPLRGGRLALLGNGGGMTVLATDQLAVNGLDLATLERRTQERIAVLDAPAGATLGNPSDLPAGALNSAGTEVARQVVAALLDDPGVDGILVHFNLLALLNYADPDAFAVALTEILGQASGAAKPLFAAVRATPDARCERLRLIVTDACQAADIPTFATVQEAVRAAAGSLARSRFTATHAEPRSTPDGPPVASELPTTRPPGAGTVPMRTGRDVLEAAGITCVASRFVHTETEAVAAASSLGFPVVLKLDSSGVSHKSDVGGVRLHLDSESQVRAAFRDLVELSQAEDAGVLRSVLVQAMVPGGDAVELLVGFHRDPVLGPMLLAGMGGTTVEVVGDVRARMPPIEADEARRMLRELRGAPLLEAFRGRPARDLDATAELIANFSRLVTALPDWIEAIDLNPVLALAQGDGVLAVDWRFSLVTPHDSSANQPTEHEGSTP